MYYSQQSLILRYAEMLIWSFTFDFNLSKYFFKLQINNFLLISNAY